MLVIKSTVTSDVRFATVRFTEAEAALSDTDAAMLLAPKLNREAWNGCVLERRTGRRTTDTYARVVLWRRATDKN